MKLLFLAALMLSPALAAGDYVIHKEKSLYRNIVVNQRSGTRCLVFSQKREERNQTCIDLNNPKRIIFPYVRMSFAGLLVNPGPKHGLMIGMGGGTISTVLSEVFPELTMDLVEVDASVVKVATEYFGFTASENVRVHVADGRVFTKRARQNDARYDLIILDAFTGDYIPEHLMTVEFLEDVKALLTPDGVVVANTFSDSALYHYESVTYSKVFGSILNLKLPSTGNRVIVASNTALPDNKTLIDNARKLNRKFYAYDIDLQRYVPNMKRTPDWDTEKRPLTDQFSPANLLRSR